MSDQDNGQNGAAPPAADSPEQETFTLTRAQLDEFRQRAASEHVPAAAAAAPEDPLQRYYAGVAARKPSETRGPPKPANAANDSNDALGRIARLMELQLLQSVAPPPPKPVVPMSLDQKLASQDVGVWLGRDPHNAISPADRAALVQRHVSKLTSEGFTGDLQRTAEERASRELSAAFTRNIGNTRVAIDRTGDQLPARLRRG